MSRLFLGVLLVAGCLGCETLRPAVGSEAAEPLSGELQRALAVNQNAASLPELTAALRTIIQQSTDEDEVEAARRLLATRYAEWYQLAHIAHDLLDERGGRTVFEGLERDLAASGPDLAFVVADRPLPQRLEFIRPLLVDSEQPTRPSEVKRRLNTELLGYERSAEQKTRSTAAIARRFLALEAGWRYDRTFRGSAARTKEQLAFLRRREAAGLGDNAWLALKLALELPLAKPTLPRRHLVESVATVLGVSPEGTGKKPYIGLIEMGDGRGDTIPERIWYAWRHVRLRLTRVLDQTGVASPNTDGRRAYNHLAPYLGIRPPPEAPTAAELHALGEGIRTEAVTHWLGTLSVGALTNRRSLDQLESTLRALLAEPKPGREAQQQETRLVAMAVLAMEEAVVVALGDKVRGRMVRLVDRGAFDKRSLVLPGGLVTPSFPMKIRRCIEPKAAEPAGCLRRLLEDLVKRASALR